MLNIIMMTVITLNVILVIVMLHKKIGLRANPIRNRSKFTHSSSKLDHFIICTIFYFNTTIGNLIKRASKLTPNFFKGFIVASAFREPAATHLLGGQDVGAELAEDRHVQLLVPLLQFPLLGVAVIDVVLWVVSIL